MPRLTVLIRLSEFSTGENPGAINAVILMESWTNALREQALKLKIPYVAVK